MSKTKKEKVVKKVPSYNNIPSEVEVMGRTIKTVDDSYALNLTRNFGEARGGVNQIALTTTVGGQIIVPEELKITYLHELLHFILNFTNYDPIFREKGIDVEQFIELMAAALYQYEKTAKF